MTIARAQLVDSSVTRWYHCVSRCVRRASLLGEGTFDRKAWLEHRLQELAQIFSVSLGGFTVLDNHLHVLIRLDPEAAAAWSDEQVVRRWGRLFPPHDGAAARAGRQRMGQGQLKNAAWVATARERLEPRLVHEVPERAARPTGQPGRETGGAFFEGRFKSVAILEEDRCWRSASILISTWGGRYHVGAQGKRAHVDQATGRARPGTGTYPGPEGRPSR